MYYGNYFIAGHTVEICSVCSDVHELCSDYRCPQAADISVNITQADIDEERRRSDRAALKAGKIPYNFSDGYLETLAVYRRIAENMVRYDTLLIHGSAIAVDGTAYMFTAKSGTGKSTHTALWRQMFGDRAVMVNDDKPLVQLCSEGAVVYGTPYNGKHRLGENTSAPLKAICILERGEENAIRRLTKAEAYPTILQQTYRPRDAKGLAEALALLDRLLSNICIYRLRCNMDQDAARVSFEGMNAPE